MSRTYKYRLYPTDKQKSILWEHSKICTKVYNHFIELEQKTYKEQNKYLNVYALNALLVSIKLSDKSLQAIYSQVLQQISWRVHRGYMLFFKKAVLHPPRQQNDKHFFSLTYPQGGYKIQDGKFITSAYGDIKLKIHRPYQETVKQVTITYDDFRWYLCVTTNHDPVDHLTTSNSKIALDLGTKDLYTTEQGVKVKGPTHQTYYRLQIANLQQLKEKCKNGSRRHKHLSRLIRKLYLKMVRKTNDYLHKVSHDLSTKYDTVIVEDLNVKQMSESKIRGRNRQIHNACMSKFVSMLEYKCKRLIKVNPDYTSQTCCLCHHKLDKKLPLNKRTFKCPHCCLKLDRDQNAAVNILQLGYASVSGFFKKNVSIVDIPELMFIDQDTKQCLEQAIA